MRQRQGGYGEKKMQSSVTVAIFASRQHKYLLHIMKRFHRKVNQIKKLKKWC